jgi:hypothetical protein
MSGVFAEDDHLPAGLRQPRREPVNVELLFIDGCPQVSGALACIEHIVRQAMPAGLLATRST